MAKNFEGIMQELGELIKEAEANQAGPAEIGGSVVNGMTGVVGANAPAKDVKGDASLRHPHKDGDVMQRPNKESEYPDPIRNPNGGRESQKVKKSEIGDDDLRMEDKPEKKAALRSIRILDTVDEILDDIVEKKAAVMDESLDQLALQKSAAFISGQEAAQRYLALTKQAMEQNGEALKNSPEHRGDLADTAVSKLIPRSDPHAVSDGKSPESEPSQTQYRKAKSQDQGNAHVEDTLEAKASLALMKAQLMDELEKAARSQDPAAELIAKANIIDFIEEYREVL